VRHSDEPKLSRPAIDAVSSYIKKYDLQPAIKDGKYVEQRNIELPIIFDMSIYEKNN
jgi:hypothetical protein